MAQPITSEAKNKAPAPPPHQCGTCGARWGGLNTCHCCSCHLTFTGLTAFDKHRDGKHPTGRHCLPPEQVGLEDAGRDYPCMGFPGFAPGENPWEAA